MLLLVQIILLPLFRKEKNFVEKLPNGPVFYCSPNDEDAEGYHDVIDRKLITVILRPSPSCLVVKLSPTVKLLLLPP